MCILYNKVGLFCYATGNPYVLQEIGGCTSQWANIISLCCLVSVSGIQAEILTYYIMPVTYAWREFLIYDDVQHVFCGRVDIGCCVYKCIYFLLVSHQINIFNKNLISSGLILQILLYFISSL